MSALILLQTSGTSWLPSGSVEDWSLRVFLCIAIVSLVWALRMFINGSWVVARWQYDKLEEQFTSVEHENTELNEAVAGLRDELGSARAQLAGMNEKITTMSQTIGRLETEVQFLRSAGNGGRGAE